MRKTNLAQLLRGRPDGIFVAPLEQGEIGPDLFSAACNMGPEGMVSKRADWPYAPAGRRIGSSEEPHPPGDVSREGCFLVTRGEA